MCSIICSWANWVGPIFTDLVIFLDVPFMMELIFLKWTQVGVHLVISMTVGALEGMWTWFTFFCLKMRGISFLICFAILPKLTIVFSLVRAIALDVLGALDTAGHSHMSPLPAILVLRNARIYVGSSNGCNKPSYIETPVNKTFSLTSTLNILDVNPNNWHIRLGWHFDDTQFWHENNIVKYLILFNNAFNLTWCKTFIRWIMREVGNAYDFQIGLWLG